MPAQDVWAATGIVVHGEQRGRAIGFPTANVELAERVELPDDGIYAGVATASAGSGLCRAAAISVGTNPTFDGQRRTLEAHLLDFDGDLYGQWLTVSSAVRLRGMHKFPDIAALIEAITDDVAATRRLATQGLVLPRADPSAQQPSVPVS